MNTIEIVNDKIINSIDDTINVSLEEKTVFFDVKTIKINILKDTNLFIKINNDELKKMNIIFNVKENVNFNLLEINNSIVKTQYIFDLETNSTTFVFKFNDIIEGKERTIINLKGTNAKIDYNFKTISKTNEEYDYIINHKSNNTESNVNVNGVNILDLCTGSGAIAVSLDRILRKNCVDAKICASDISKQALKIARKNSENNNANVKIIESDLLENIEYKKFDIIVSNPPYIRTDEIKNLSKQVKEEPYIALNGGIDGLHFYRKIIKEAKGYIKNNGYLCLEIGYNQMESVLGIFKENKEYKNLKQVKDWSGNDRCIIAQKLE